MPRPEFRHIRRTVYALKRAYPLAISLRRTTNNATDLKTGARTADVQAVYIAKAVLLPSRGLRDFAYDLSFIAANKNFTYGGYYDHRFRRVLIDRRDIPATFPLNLNMYVIFDERRYEVKEIFEYEHKECIVLVLDSMDGVPPGDVINAPVQQSLGITDGNGAVLQ